MRSPYIIIAVAGIISLGLVASVYLYSQQKLRLEQYKDKTRQAEEQEKRDYEGRQQQEKRAYDEKAKKLIEAKLEACSADVKARSDLWWDRECVSLGRKKDCLLPSYNADRITENSKEELDRCVELYRSN